MQFYSSATSPFGTRIVIAARAKNIELPTATLPADGLKSPEFLAINPIAKIPVMVTDAGTIIPESEAILRYLEDRYPNPSLMPADAEQRARVNLLVRITDIYVMAPVIRLFPHLDPTTRDASVVEAEVERWKQGLSVLAHFMTAPLPDAPTGLSLADCVLPPSLALSAIIAQMLGLGDLLAGHPALVEYDARLRGHPIVGKVLDELAAALAALTAH